MGDATRTSCSSWPRRSRSAAPAGAARGVAVMTCSGGDSRVAADLADELGVALPGARAGDRRAARASCCPRRPRAANPLDYTALLWDEPRRAARHRRARSRDDPARRPRARALRPAAPGSTARRRSLGGGRSTACARRRARARVPVARRARRCPSCSTTRRPPACSADGMPAVAGLRTGAALRCRARRRRRPTRRGSPRSRAARRRARTAAAAAGSPSTRPRRCCAPPACPSSDGAVAARRGRRGRRAGASSAARSRSSCPARRCGTRPSAARVRARPRRPSAPSAPRAARLLELPAAAAPLLVERMAPPGVELLVAVRARRRRARARRRRSAASGPRCSTTSRVVPLPADARARRARAARAARRRCYGARGRRRRRRRRRAARRRAGELLLEPASSCSSSTPCSSTATARVAVDALAAPTGDHRMNAIAAQLGEVGLPAPDQRARRHATGTPSSSAAATTA